MLTCLNGCGIDSHRPKSKNADSAIQMTMTTTTTTTAKTMIENNLFLVNGCVSNVVSFLEKCRTTDVAAAAAVDVKKKKNSENILIWLELDPFFIFSLLLRQSQLSR